jgi:hypothetical protein
MRCPPLTVVVAVAVAVACGRGSSRTDSVSTKAVDPSPPAAPASAPASTREVQPQFAVGQRWRYRTRVGEDNSTLVIGLIEDRADLGRVVHITVEGLEIRRPGGAVVDRVGHVPISEPAVARSVLALEATGVATPSLMEGYTVWRDALGQGAGVFDISVADAVETIASGLQR